MSERTSLPIPSRHGSNAGWRRLHLREWERLGPQKRGVDCYRNPIFNKWLWGRIFLSEREFLCALKLRSNTLPTKETRRGMDVLCRRCGRTVETTGLISGACTSVLPERIARHTRLCAGLQKACPSVGLGITVELRYHPDLILRGGDTCYIVDPTVVWDGDMARQDVAHREKVRKYIKQLYRRSRLYTVFCTLKSMDSLSERGVQWTPLNDEVANVLDLKNGQVQRLCQIALCDTVKLVQTFFDLYGYVSRDSNGGGGGGGGGHTADTAGRPFGTSRVSSAHTSSSGTMSQSRSPSISSTPGLAIPERIARHNRLCAGLQ